MAGNQMLDALADAARDLGWSSPEGIDHVEYVNRAIRAMKAFVDAGQETGWLVHAYAQEYRDLTRGIKGLAHVQPFVPPGDASGLFALATVAPSIWLAEVSLLAYGRRRTGRAQKLVRSCRRIQLSMVRHGVDPVARWRARATPVGDDVRARGFFLLSRETELEEERDWREFWEGVALADARTTTPTRTTGGRGEERGDEAILVDVDKDADWDEWSPFRGR